jgi:predicted metal-dependent phosphotriesterase family hydrolase
MPTFDSEHTNAAQGRPFVSVSRAGKLLPEVEAVLALMAQKNLVLATGHSSPEEVLMLIRAAKAAGVKQIIVTHPMNQQVGMSVAQMKEAARLGAFLEFARVPPDSADMPITADAIRQIGAASCILSSDLGQEGNPLHTDGLLRFFQGLKDLGISEADIARMSKANPATLLGWKVE